MQSITIEENATVHYVWVHVNINTYISTHITLPAAKQRKGHWCSDYHHGTSIIHPNLPACIRAVILGAYNLSIIDCVMFWYSSLKRIVEEKEHKWPEAEE